jgi:hypothetical protein
LRDEVAGEAVCPEAFGPFAKGDLEFDFLRFVAVFAEEIERVFEDLEMVSR